MKIKVLVHPIANYHGEAVILSLFEDEKPTGGPTAAIGRALGALISKLRKENEITGKLGEVTVLHACKDMKTSRVIVVGLGKRSEFGYEHIRRAAGAAAKKARQINAKHIGTLVHGAGNEGLDTALAVQSVVEGTCLALYEFSAYKQADTKRRINELAIIMPGCKDAGRLRSAAARGQTLADAQNIARDLINEPGNNLTPERLHKRVQSIIRDWGLSGVIKCRCLNQNTLKRMGMGALLAVAQGSVHPARFIVLHLKTARRPLVSLIGKTVTFDSGGISIKPSTGMGSMKGDMAGGAIAFATTLALARTKCRINLMTLIPAVENMPSGSASRPGDIVRAMNGKTVEIISTDAEGRMTLADALVYAEKKGAGVIVDIATLTGGCVVALGNLIAALMGNDQALAERLIELSDLTGEKFWQLPLCEEYQKQIKSDVADLKNSGGRDASTITAGLFLKSFVDKARWLHIDIAGKELAEKEAHYTPRGATGFGVRSLYDLFRAL
ncbi:leucyl aminopeptidase [candidate division WOR-3 bacterium]|nr:leucyl aminopeptidase [candidate division WOR-3 bacterium]